ncbi:MAG TPA: tetratricopeptide repeat protein, partial [Thermoanaerobaculia bacterium]|nr:tetratricopeptide repeat protein [Thermoanaerobaculia bacterium]
YQSMTTTPSPIRTERSFYEFDGFRLDPVRRRLLRAGQSVPLTPKAFSILLALIEKRGEVMEKEELIQKVWPDSYVTEANLTQNISSLRKALGERANDHRYVVTVPGRGYSFVADILEVPREQTGEHSIAAYLSDSGPLPVSPSAETRSDATPPGGISLDDTASFALRPQVTEPVAVQPPMPVRGRRRFLVAGLLLGFLLAASVAGLFLYFQERGAARTDVSEASDRPVVAVMGFRNLSKNPDQSWLSTALAEMLITELATGSEIRMVSGEEIFRVRNSLSLPYTEEPSGENLQRIQEALGADLVVVGSYLSLGDEAGDRLRIDLRVLRVPDGEPLASLAQVGTEEELFELVARIGRELRQTLNWAQPSPEEVRAAHARQPRNPEAARLYVQGLMRLRAFDSQGARDLLDKAAEKDPESAMIRSALSLAWMGVGNDAEARREAAEALRLSASLPKPERLAAEARFAEADKDWPRAAELYRSLWTFYPDLEFGLRLVNSLSWAGRGKEALTIVDELRKLLPPQGEDPRIDLTEAQVAKRLSSFVIQRHAAKVAEEKGRKSGETQVVAQALVLQGDWMLQIGRPRDAVTLFEEARGLFERSGNQGAVASVLTHLGVAYHKMGDMTKAEETYLKSLAMLRQVGSGQGVAVQMANLGIFYQDQGDIHRARKSLEEAHADFVREGDRVLGARAVNALGTLLVSSGDLAGGRRRFEQVLATSRQTGSRTDEARSLHFLGLAAARQGAWKEAQRRHDEAYKIALGLQEPGKAAMMLAAIAEAQVRLGDLPGAERHFNQALAMKQRAQDKAGAAEILGSLAQLEYRRGNLAKAKALSQNQARIARSIGSRTLAAAALQALSRWSLEEGDSKTAWRQLDQVAKERAGMGDTMEAAAARLGLANVAFRQGSFKEAEQIASELAAWYGARRMVGHQARALALEAGALLAQGRIGKAELSALRAYSICQQSDDIELRIEIFAAVAPIGAATDSARQALGHLRWGVSEAQRIGYVSAGFEAQLMLGALQLQTGDALHGRATLESVRRAAEARGFRRVAREAEEFLGGTRSAVPPTLPLP